MGGRYGKGCKPSPAHRVGLGNPTHLASVVIPQAAEVLLPPVVQQGNTSSCTGNSSAVAICAAMARAANLPPGQFPELPSRLFLYFMARSTEGEADVDDGAIIADIFDEAALVGVPPESAWTFSEDIAKITAQPDWYAIRRAADQKLKLSVAGAWRISTTGAQRVRDVQAAIASGSAVVLGTELDQAFEDLTPGRVWPGLVGPSIGGHAIVCCAYRTHIDGSVDFKLQNSWGADWCDHGTCWISSAAVASSHCSDLWVVSAAVPYSEAA